MFFVKPILKLSSKSKDKYIIVIDGGGTAFKLGVYTPEGKIKDQVDLPFEKPDVLIPKLITFIKQKQKQYDIGGIGLATFGPLELDPTSKNYGSITSTNRPGWKNCPIFRILKNAFPKLVITIQNDLDASASAHFYAQEKKSEKKLKSILLVSVATGLGASFISENNLPSSRTANSEAGHMPINRLADDNFQGACSCHNGNYPCVESLAAGAAIIARSGISPPKPIPSDNPAWKYTIHYLAHFLATQILTHRPEKVVLTGGVILSNPWVVKAITDKAQKMLNKFVDFPEISITSLGRDADLLGAGKTTAVALSKQSPTLLQSTNDEKITAPSSAPLLRSSL